MTINNHLLQSSLPVHIMHKTIAKYIKLKFTSGYGTMVHAAGGAIRIAVQLSQTWKLRHYDVIDDVITRNL